MEAGKVLEQERPVVERLLAGEAEDGPKTISDGERLLNALLGHPKVIVKGVELEESIVREAVTDKFRDVLSTKVHALDGSRRVFQSQFAADREVRKFLDKELGPKGKEQDLERLREDLRRTLGKQVVPDVEKELPTRRPVRLSPSPRPLPTGKDLTAAQQELDQVKGVNIYGVQADGNGHVYARVRTKHEWRDDLPFIGGPRALTNDQVGALNSTLKALESNDLGPNGIHWQTIPKIPVHLTPDVATTRPIYQPPVNELPPRLPGYRPHAAEAGGGSVRKPTTTTAQAVKDMNLRGSGDVPGEPVQTRGNPVRLDHSPQEEIPDDGASVPPGGGGAGRKKTSTSPEPPEQPDAGRVHVTPLNESEQQEMLDYLQKTIGATGDVHKIKMANDISSFVEYVPENVYVARKGASVVGVMVGAESNGTFMVSRLVGTGQDAAPELLQQAWNLSNGRIELDATTDALSYYKTKYSNAQVNEDMHKVIFDKRPQPCRASGLATAIPAMEARLGAGLSVNPGFFRAHGSLDLEQFADIGRRVNPTGNRYENCGACTAEVIERLTASGGESFRAASGANSPAGWMDRLGLNSRYRIYQDESLIQHDGTTSDALATRLQPGETGVLTRLPDMRPGGDPQDHTVAVVKDLQGSVTLVDAQRNIVTSDPKQIDEPFPRGLSILQTHRL